MEGRWTEGATSVTILNPWYWLQRSTSPLMVVNFSICFVIVLSVLPNGSTYLRKRAWPIAVQTAMST